MLAYLWGFVLLVLMFIGQSKLKPCTYSNNIFKLLGLVVLFACVSFLINYFIVDSHVNNLIWFGITYGSFASFICALLLMSFEEKDLFKIFRFMALLTVFEIVFGYGQMIVRFQSFNPFSVVSAAGDFFTGTFLRFGYAHLAALKISLVVIYCYFIWVSNWKIKMGILLIVLIIGWFLPSALYSTLLLVLSFFIYYASTVVVPNLLRFRIKMSVLYITIAIMGGLLLFSLTQKRNVSYIFNSLNTISQTIFAEMDKAESAQKVHFYRTTIVDLPSTYPYAIISGLGPGNYSSRAAWIVSGLYLSSQPFYIPVTPSEAATMYALPYFEDIVNEVRWGAGSVIHQPFASWLAIIAEVGIVGLILVLWLFKNLFQNPKNYTSQIGPFIKGNSVALIYLVLLMFVDNIIEYPQFMNQLAIFFVIANKLDQKKIE